MSFECANLKETTKTSAGSPTVKLPRIYSTEQVPPLTFPLLLSYVDAFILYPNQLLVVMVVKDKLT